MRRLWVRLADEFQTEKEMRRLIDHLADGLHARGPAVPADADSLCAALITVVRDLRGRDIEVLKEEFPHRTATGLWLDLPTHDLIVIDKRAAPLHQLAIFCHEIWHMIKDDCGHHVAGVDVAARMLDNNADLRNLKQTVLRVAARSVFDEKAEQSAETFALKAVTQFRIWLEGQPDHLAQDRTRVAGRIGASLGSRRPQV